MSKKHYFITVDTETTQAGKVADFAAVITDRKGNIMAQCSVLIDGVFNSPTDKLFSVLKNDGSAFSPDRLESRYNAYFDQLANGQRMLASVPAVNRWLYKAILQYDPILTAYNIAFDLDKCLKTGIDLSGFTNKFCLWYRAASHWGKTREYRKFILDNHLFNPPTQHGNMSYKTNAEIMAAFVQGGEVITEPHLALEDVLYFELPILNRLIQLYSVKKLIEPTTAYNWQNYQVKNNYHVK